MKQVVLKAVMKMLAAMKMKIMKKLKKKKIRKLKTSNNGNSHVISLRLINHLNSNIHSQVDIIAKLTILYS